MRNALLSVLMVLTLVGGVLLGAHHLSRTATEAATPVPVVAQLPVKDDGLGICVPPVVCVTVPVPVEVGVTVTATRLIPAPGITVSLPRATRIITLPPTRRTIIVPRTVTGAPVTRTVRAPGGTTTVTRPGLPGATRTATVVVQQRIIQNGIQPPVTQEVRRTVSAPPARTTVRPPGRVGQPVTTRVTVAPSKEVVQLPGTTIEVTKIQAVGLSLLGLLALMGLGLLLLWLGFILGYKSSEKENTNFLRALRDSIKRKPGKHELG